MTRRLLTFAREKAEDFQWELASVPAEPDHLVAQASSSLCEPEVLNTLKSTRNAIHFDALYTTLSRLGITHRRTAYHHPEGTVPSQLEGGGTLGSRVSQHRKGARVDWKNIDKPVVRFPEVVVCLDCGTAEFAVPQAGLRQLAKGEVAAAG